MRTLALSSLMLLVGVSSCKRDELTLSGRRCDLSQPSYPCVSGYVCNQDGVCARLLPPNCDDDTRCPSRATSLPCATVGDLLPCTDEATSCIDGCLVCGSDKVWSVCSQDACVLGEVTSCGSCSDDCTGSGRIAHATPICVFSPGAQQRVCDYSECEPGYVDHDRDRGNGCECEQSIDGTITCNGVPVGECTPGVLSRPEPCPASLTDTGCGLCRRECQPDYTWPTSCTTACVVYAGECQSSVAPEPCGYCGTRTRTCQASCEWGDYSQCSDTGLQYYPLAAPCFLTDGLALSASTPHMLDVTGSGCGIPQTARAVAVMIAANDANHVQGHVAVGCSSTVPAVSILNFPAGGSRASNSIVALSADGKAYFASPVPCSLTVAATGYFAALGEGGQSYYAIRPARLFDSINAPPRLLYDQTPLDLAAQGTSSIPSSGVTALVFNATVVSPPQSGYLWLYAAGATRPNPFVSYLPVGATVANGGIVSLRSTVSAPASDYQAFASLTPNDTTGFRLIVDTSGYFAPELPPSSVPPLRYYVVPPCRRIYLKNVAPNTRIALQGYADEGRSSCTAESSIPVEARAVVIHLAVEVAEGGAGHVSLHPAQLTYVGGDPSLLNYPVVAENETVIVGNGAIVTLGAAEANHELTFVTPRSILHLYIDVYGYFRE